MGCLDDCLSIIAQGVLGALVWCLRLQGWLRVQLFRIMQVFVWYSSLRVRVGFRA